MATNMATDFDKMLDPSWLLIMPDGSLHSIDWAKAEVLAEEWKKGVHNASTNTAVVAVAIRDHLTVRPKE